MTALLILTPFPILAMVVLTDHFARRKTGRILSKLAFTLAVCAEIPMMVWVHRSVADESLALYIAYGGAILTVYAESVSYTHLRAHETVLDLLFRLLLEKNT